MAGWKLGPVDGVDLPKCIVCVAPHTSNWDFIVGKLFYTSIGRNASFLIKKDEDMDTVKKSTGGLR